MDITDWYWKTVGTTSINAVAKRAGLSQATINRQLKEGKLTAETVASVARAFGEDVLTALVIQGLIKRDDLQGNDFEKLAALINLENLSQYTDVELADEIARRFHEAAEGTTAFDEPPILPSPPRAFEVYTNEEFNEDEYAAQTGHVDYDRGCDDDAGEESQLPPDDWDE